MGNDELEETIANAAIANRAAASLIHDQRQEIAWLKQQVQELLYAEWKSLRGK